MRKYPILVFLFLFCLKLVAQTTNLIKDGDFSTYDPTAWTTSGYFNYVGCIYYPCDGQYAYTSGVCSNVDDATGALYQDFRIPNDCTGGTLSFSQRIGTTNFSSPSDLLTVY